MLQPYCCPLEMGWELHDHHSGKQSINHIQEISREDHSVLQVTNRFKDIAVC